MQPLKRAWRSIFGGPDEQQRQQSPPAKRPLVGPLVHTEPIITTMAAAETPVPRAATASDLPRDIWTLVFRFLDSTKHYSVRLTLRAVCRMFRSVVPQPWPNFDRPGMYDTHKCYHCRTQILPGEHREILLKPKASTYRDVWRLHICSRKCYDEIVRFILLHWANGEWARLEISVEEESASFMIRIDATRRRSSESAVKALKEDAQVDALKQRIHLDE